MGPRAKKKALLSQTEIAGLKDVKNDLEHTLKEAKGFGSGTAGEQMDTNKIQAEIRHYDNEIAAGSAGRVTAKTKDSMHREEKELEEHFKRGLPTRDEMRHPGHNPGAVRKHMTWLNNNEKAAPGRTSNVERYREIQRTLRPGEEKSIENLRKDK